MEMVYENEKLLTIEGSNQSAISMDMEGAEEEIL
jgi:hypothetical protein